MDQNIIGGLKMIKKYFVAIKLPSYHSSASLLNDFFASLLYFPFYSYRSSNYCDSNSWRSFSPFKAIAISFHFFCNPLWEGRIATTITVAIVGRAITICGALEQGSHEPTYKTDTKKLSKEIKSDNFCYQNVGGAITVYGGVIERSLS